MRGYKPQQSLEKRYQLSQYFEQQLAFYLDDLVFLLIFLPHLAEV